MPRFPTASSLMHAAGCPPDPWQADLINSTARQVLLCCSRQVGKSTVCAAIALQEALLTSGALILMLAPSHRQSQELYRRLLSFYRAVGRPRPADSETSLRLTLDNGSRVIALPGSEDTIRGFSGVNVLVVDEAARVPDELYFAVRPMLAVSGGRLLALSTPYGRRGWFFREWSEGGKGWERISIPASKCPRIDTDFLKSEERSLGPLWYRQEYQCEFVYASDQAFLDEDISDAMDPDLEPLFPDYL